MTCRCCEGTSGRGHKILVVGGDLCVICKHPALGHKKATSPVPRWYPNGIRKSAVR